MADPDSKEFLGQTSGKQCDFVEIVNSTNKRLDLDGLTLNILRTDNDKNDTSQSHKLTGVLPAKGAVVVLGKDCQFIAQEGVITNTHRTANYLVATATYELWLSKGDTAGTKVAYKNAGKGISSNRTPDRNATSELVSQKDNVAGYKHSPGLCDNGGQFIDDCRNPDNID